MPTPRLYKTTAWHSVREERVRRLRRAESEEKSPDHYPGSSLGRCTSERRYSALLASSDQDQLLGSFLVCVRAAEKKPPTGVATAVGEVTGKKPFGLEYRFTEQR